MAIFKTKGLARFFDKKGQYLGKQSFKLTDTTFKYNDKRYTVNSETLSYFERDKWLSLFCDREYFYFVNSISPMEFNNNKITYETITPEQLNVIIETDVAKKLNSIGLSGMPDWLNWKFIVIGIIVIVGIAYLFKGGKLA